MAFNKETAEMLATALSYIGVLPSFDGALLFTDEIFDITGFQIRCNKNQTGRMVFSLPNGDRGSYENFTKQYEKIHGNTLRNTTHDINIPTYPAMGADYAEDISPAAIVRILRVAMEESNELFAIIPVFLMQVAKEAGKWEQFFGKLHRDTAMVKKAFEKVYQEVF